MSDSVAWSSDLMGRKGVAKYLTKLLDTDATIKVLNINASWGTGKTFFLENWKMEQQKSRVCIYFNAWEADYTGEPFVALASVIREQVQDLLGDIPTSGELISSFTNKAAKTLIAATPALAKGVVKKFTGVDLSLITDVVDEDALADAAEKAVEKLIESNKESINIVKDFKQNFHKLISSASSALADSREPKPAYIFIDELDRCRPTFAVELLERIKHIFDIPDCKFIIATDTLQLSHSIRAIYGAGFGSEKYLKRFFDREYTIHNTDPSQWIKFNVALEGDVGILELGIQRNPRSSTHPAFPGSVEPNSKTILAGPLDLNECQLVILALTKTFGPKLRELARIVSQIDSMRANASGPAFAFFWASYLAFLKDEAPDLFDIAIRGDFHSVVEPLNRRYAPAMFNFYTLNVSVHEMFHFYLVRYRAGKDGARAQARADRDSGIHYVINTNEMFHNNYEAMSQYPALAELAHSLA